MRIIGIAGGVASGKSLAAGKLEQLGAVSIDVDRIGHGVLRQPEVHGQARSRWGDRIFLENGEIDRTTLAEIVFGDSSGKELSFLESTTFPKIRACLEAELTNLRSKGVAVVAVDAAVMFKAHWDRLCDVILFVDAAAEVRLARARARGWTDEQFAAREATQVSLATKRARADIVIDNNDSVDKTKAQMERFWLSLDSFFPNNTSSSDT